MEGYKWFGHNRKHLHRKAVRGSSVVGVLVRGSAETLPSRDLECRGEDMLWVRLNLGEEEWGLVLAVCYVPPESSHGRSSEGYLQLLAEQVEIKVWGVGTSGGMWGF